MSRGGKGNPGGRHAMTVGGEASAKPLSWIFQPCAARERLLTVAPPRINKSLNIEQIELGNHTDLSNM